MTQELRRAAIDWIKAKDIKWDLACRWHGSNYLRAQQRGGAAPTWLQQHLRRHFHELDRLVLKTAYTKHEHRIQRLVVIEYKQDVGWHAHGMIRTPPGYMPERLHALMERMWLRRMQVEAHDRLKLDYFWREQPGPGYVPYIFKHTWKHPDEFHGDKDRGFVDLDITRL